MTPPPPREVADGFIVAADGRLLLQLRDNEGVPAAGMWGLFGGGVEVGETPAEAFLREMREELGWRPKHLELYTTIDVDWGGPVRAYDFAAHLDLPLDALTLGEGQAMALFAPDALPEGIVPGIADELRRFAASDAYRRVKHAYDAITATALLVDAEGRFLLQHRDDKPDIANPGMWGSFGGEVEPYETPEQGFLREMQEELGWTPAAYGLYVAGPLTSGGRRLLVYVYAGPLDVPIDHLTLGEGQGMAAFAPNALPATTVPALRALIERFVATRAYGDLRVRARHSRRADGVGTEL